MIQEIINQYDFNLAFARKLVEDLTTDQMTTCPSIGFENHPAFTLGHLVTGSALLIEDMGAMYEVPEGWSELFLRNGPGDPTLPTLNKTIYPEKLALLAELEKQHELVKLTLNKLTYLQLNESIKWRFLSFMPKLKDLIVFMCINHEAMHLGQLSAWRRAMRLHSALGQM